LLKGYNTPTHLNWTCVVNLTRNLLAFSANLTVSINQTMPNVSNLTNESVLNITSLWTVNASYKIGKNVTIFANWTGWDANTSVMWYVCNSSSITRYGCLDSFVCAPPTAFSNDTSLNCTFNTSIYTNITKNYYSIVCDDEGNCSNVAENKIHLSYKIIVPDPVVENVSILPASANLSSNLVCDYDFGGFGYAENTTMAEYIWYLYNGTEYERMIYDNYSSVNNSLEIGGIFDVNDTLMCSAKAFNVNGTNSSFVNSTNITINNAVKKYNQIINVTSADDLSFIFSSPTQTYSFDLGSDANMTIYGQELFNITILNDDSSFMAMVYDFNISNSSNFVVLAEYPALLSLFENDSLNMAVDKSERYLITSAYAFYINVENVTVAYNYTGIVNITDVADVSLWKFAFDHFNLHTHDPGSVEYLSIVNIGDWVYANVTNLSAFVLLNDQASAEVCGNAIDEDYDGTAQSCPKPSSSGGGRRRTSSSPVILLVDPLENCTDGILNQGEQGIDCGGPCIACPVVLPPTIVPQGPTCYDGILNQGETDVDCGGPCRACDYCNDGVKNSGETAIDCGGPCRPCPSCDDGKVNQGETGTDCGGPCAACAPTCSDRVMNQGETDVDCGGPCTACPVTEEPKAKGNILPFVLMLIILFVAVAAYIFKDTMKKSFPEEHDKVKPLTLKPAQKPLEKAAPKIEKQPEKLGMKIPPLKAMYKEETSVDDLHLKPQERLNLEKYVYHELARGFSEIEVKDALFRNGWPTFPIETLFRRIRNLDEVMQKHDLHTPHQNFEALIESLQNLFNQLWEQGYREEEITSLMLSKGWPKRTINKAFEYMLRTYNNQFMNN